MKLIVGLGNPGEKYKTTWHNLGFLAIEKLAKEFDFGKFKLGKKLNAEIAVGKIGSEKIILAEPQTYMNNSGLAVQAVAQFYKIDPIDIIVVHDDIDLPLGKIRIAHDSSAGGHNGVKSIIEHLNTKEFVRIKIGSQTENTTKIGALDYVLERISKADRKLIDETIKKTTSVIKEVVEFGLEKSMNDFN